MIEVDFKEGQMEQLIELINYDGQIKALRLLYRASQNKFSAKKFHELCDNIPNTFVLVKNSNNFIYGGFTPCLWSSPNVVT